MTDIRAVFIDIDNTLLDFDAYVKESLKNGFRKFNLKKFVHEDYEIFTKINNSLWHDLEKGKIELEELKKIRFNTVFKALGISYDGIAFEKYFRECLNESAIPVEGSIDLLDYLKGRYILCAASNGPTYQQKHRLHIAGIYKYFDHIFLSEELGVSKPSKAFFDKAFINLNVSPADCLFIGDSLTADIKGGTEYGMKTFYFNKQKKDYSTSPVQPDKASERLLDAIELFAL